MKFHVPDMTCGNCASHITKAIESLDGNARIDISLEDKIVDVTSSASVDAVAAAIVAEGYTPAVQAS